MLFVLLGVAYSLAGPFGEPPDEPAHYDYIWYLQKYHQLPSQVADLEQTPVDEGHHPPVYYTIVALLTHWAPYAPYNLIVNPYLPEGYSDPHIVQQFLHPPQERFPWPKPLIAAHIARLVSVAMGGLSIWVTYRVGRHIARQAGHPAGRLGALALLAASIHAFIPQFIYISSAINNDNAAILMGALITLQLVRLLHNPPQTLPNSGFLLLGVLMGLGILCKISLMAMFPAIGWVILYTTIISTGVFTRWKWLRYYGPSGRDPSTTLRMTKTEPRMTKTEPRKIEVDILIFTKRLLVKGSLVILPILILSGWWMWRNIQLYDDPLAWNIWMATYARFERQLPITPDYVLDFWWQQFRSFWGVFGWGRVSLPDWIYLALMLLTFVSVAGVIQYLRRRRDQIPHVLTLALIFGGFLLSTWRLGLSLDTTAAQGRFLFPALSAITTLLALGWLAWLPRRTVPGRVWLFLISGFFLLASAALLFRLIPVHIRPIRNTLPAKATRVHGAFEPWELTGWQAPQPVSGKPWPVTLYWRATRELHDEEKHMAPILFVHLVDIKGNAIAKWDGVPTQGRLPPPAWHPDSIIADTVRLQSPPQDQPRLAHLFVGFYIREENSASSGALRRIPVHSETNPTLPASLLLGPVLLRPSPAPRFQPQREMKARFGSIRLLGFDIHAPHPETETNADIQVTLYWQATETLPADYTVFVHLINREGLVVQGDAPPCDGQCPTSFWQPGDIWRDSHALPIHAGNTITRTHPPFDPAKAPYRILIGWYDPHTAMRLPAFTVDGQPLTGNQLILCEFISDPETCINNADK